MKLCRNACSIALALYCITYLSSQASALCVKKKKAYLRSGPSTNHPKSWEVYQYMPFQKVKKQGKWFQVKDLDGDFHWIYEKLVTSKYLCAVVKATKINLRMGPGVKHPINPIYPSAKKNESFKLLKVEDGWAYLEDPDGDKVWAFRKLLWVQ